jgi:spore coat protein A, manganese oxidase
MTRALIRSAALTAAAFLAGCSSNSTTHDASGGTGGSDGATDGGGTTDGRTTDGGATEGGASDGGGDASTAPLTLMPPLQPILDATKIPKYVDDVPTFNGKRADGKSAVTVQMVEFQQKILPAATYAALPAPFSDGTYLWGYKVNGGAASFPSATIEATRGTSTQVTFTNSLEGANGAPLFLQRRLVTDLSVHSADPLGFGKANNCLSQPPLPPTCIGIFAMPVPAVVHLHGAEVLSDFDGMPDTWFTPGLAHKGPAYVSNVYTYPNTQEATTLWFHDHALGMTRQHVYAGLAGFYLIRDTSDTGAANNPMGLPAGAYESELMVADRQFDINGQLYFPAGLPGDGPGINGPPPNPDHHPYWIPEFFGDVITVNGKSWPVMHVEPRRYRFRFVNASNARFFQMQLFAALNGAPTGTAGPSFWQIGSDGGFLNATTNLDSNAVPGIFIAPAERADVIVDFTGLTGSFILTNGRGCDDPANADSCGAFAPFPSGDPPDPNTSGQVMMFTVDKPVTGTDSSFNPSPAGTAVRGGTGRPPAMVNIKPAGAPNVRRQLVLVEVEGPGGPEEVLLNNSHWDGNRENLVAGATAIPIAGSVSNGHGIEATENPQVGATEIWEVANLTEDAHPIHIHLIQFQLINREAMVVGADGGDTIYRGDWDATFPGGTFNGETFDAHTFIPGYGPPANYATANADGALGGNVAFTDPKYLTGMITAPSGSESGWKDTLKMLPKTVTRIAIRYAPQGTPLTGTGAAAPGTNLFSFDPTAPGPGYVWHCHILDHEDNEMMRPYLLKK